jgi:soluble lytic murein transglycosylase-like protein
LERLRFGRRARRRARWKRFVLTGWILSTVLSIAGISIPALPLNLLLQKEPQPVTAASMRTGERSATAEHFTLRNFRLGATQGKQSPAPKSPDYSGSISQIVHAAASEYGMDGDYLMSIAACESGLDPTATSRVGYYGLFQFDEETWGAYGYGSIYDPVAQARTAASLLAAGEDERWPNCA